jgi:chemotaxis protein MotB
MSSGGAGRRRKVQHEEHEEHVNHERWLVSYADMLTLLFVLFVVLYSMSSVDQKKFSELASGLSQGFGAQNPAVTGNLSNLDGSSEAADIVPIDPGQDPGNGASGTDGMAKGKVVEVDRAIRAIDRKKAAEKAQAATKEAEDLEAIEHKIADALVRAKLLGQVQFTIDQRGLVVTVVTNEVVFAGNRADLQPGGEAILNAIAPALAKLPNNIEVDGHTNQLKAATTFYPSGWELSAARASTTVRYLIGHGLAKDRMSAVAFSDTKPLIDPTDPRAVTMNRRVDVVVLTMLPAEQAALLPSAAGGESKPHTGVTSAQAAAAKAAAAAAESTGEPATTHG